MACHGYVAYDDGTKRFTLPPEHAFVLADADSPLYLGSFIAMSQPYWANLDLLTEAFKHGRRRAAGGLRRGVLVRLRALHPHRLPQQPRAGLDPGDAPGRRGAPGGWQRRRCRLRQRPGAALPRPGLSRRDLVGYDNYPPAIAAANANAQAAGLADRVRYEVCDVTQGIPGQYDLITTFDVVHDMPHPRPAMAEIRRALKPDGTYFVLEFNFFGDLQANIDHPMGIGAFGYSASANYCMTQALAVGGEGTGTCMGEEKAREFASEGRLHATSAASTSPRTPSTSSTRSATDDATDESGNAATAVTGRLRGPRFGPRRYQEARP